MERKRGGTPQINNLSTDSSLSQPPLSSSVSFPTIVVIGRSSPIIATYFHMATTNPPKPATYLHAYRSSPGSQKSTGTPGHRDRGKRRSIAQRGYTPWRGGAAGPASPCVSREPKATSLPSISRPLSSPRRKHRFFPRAFSFPRPHKPTVFLLCCRVLRMKILWKMHLY